MRPKFLSGRLLRAEDLRSEQEYQTQALEAAGASLHTWGVGTGLEVRRTGPVEVTVGAGFALDADGRELVLDAPQVIDLSLFVALNIYLTITYRERAVSPIGDSNALHHRRIEVEPLLEAREDRPSDPRRTLILAKVVLSLLHEISEIDESERVASGVAVGRIRFPAAQSKTAASIFAREEEGALAIDAEKVDLFGSMRAGGAVGIGTRDPAAALEIGALPILRGRGKILLEGERAYGERSFLSRQLSPGDLIFAGGERAQVEGVDGPSALVSRTGGRVSTVRSDGFEYSFNLAMQVALGDGRPVLTVTRSGDVGIAVTGEPRATLHLGDGDLRLDGGRMLSFSGDGAIATADGKTAVELSSGALRLELRDPGDLVFTSGGASDLSKPALAVTSQSGWAGIGVRPPIDALTVDGIIEARALIFPDGSEQSSSVVPIPIGAIVDWWQPGGSLDVGPEGFQICNGGTVEDPESPLVGTKVPDLRDQFVRGVVSFEDIGGHGGADKHSHQVELRKHDHPMPHTHSLYTSFEGTAQRQGSDRIGKSLVFATHVHSFQTFTAGPYPETSSEYNGQEQKPTDEQSAIPEFMFLLKVMRIK